MHSRENSPTRGDNEPVTNNEAGPSGEGVINNEHKGSVNGGSKKSDRAERAANREELKARLAAAELAYKTAKERGWIKDSEDVIDNNSQDEDDDVEEETDEEMIEESESEDSDSDSVLLSKIDTIDNLMKRANISKHRKTGKSRKSKPTTRKVISVSDNEDNITSVGQMLIKMDKDNRTNQKLLVDINKGKQRKIDHEMISGNFAGEDDECVMEFVNVMEYQRTALDITDKDFAMIIGKYLKGEARTWYNRHIVKLGGSWLKIKEGLLQEYNPSTKRAEIRNRCYREYMKDGETVKEYSKRMNDLCVMGGFDDENQKELFINGLPQAMQIHVNRMSPDTYEKALKEAKVYESSDVKRGRNLDRKSSICGISTNAEGTNELQGELRVNNMGGSIKEIADYVVAAIKPTLGSKTDPNPNRDRKPIKCYNCDKLGHMAKDCRAPRKTYVPNNRSQQVGQKHCSHCNMNNHSLEECHWAQNNMPCPYCTKCQKKGHFTDKCKQASN